MKVNNKLVMFVFSLIGVLFAGYLTVTKLVLGTCPLKESCPVFFGYPACVYGFVMFLILFISSALLLPVKPKYNTAKLVGIIYYISIIGILFSIYSTIQEVFFTTCPAGVCEYSLLLPTCVYGFVMYLVIFWSVRPLRKK